MLKLRNVRFQLSSKNQLILLQIVIPSPKEACEIWTRASAASNLLSSIVACLPCFMHSGVSCSCITTHQPNPYDIEAWNFVLPLQLLLPLLASLV